MNKQTYKRLQKLINEIENEALKEGADITSPDFQWIIKELLRKKGFTLAEYLEHEKEPPKEPLELKGVASIKGDKGDKGDAIKGEAGERGLIGSQGLQGLKGEKGEKGNKGDTADLTDLKQQMKKDREWFKTIVAKNTKETSAYLDALKKDINKQNEERIKRDLLPEKLVMITGNLEYRLQSGLLDARYITGVLEIDLSSQLDGSTTTFTLGRIIKALVAVNLNGTFVTATLNTAKTQITLAFAPDSGEELLAITLI